MRKQFFITTAIDYPSQKGHIGHALEKVQADVLARYKRLQGFEVHFSTGTDEHGWKIEKSAKKYNKKPKEFVDEISKNFKEISRVLNISYDDFIRTTEKRHIKVVEEIFNKIHKKGDIYKDKYKGFYCVECETYYLPKDLEGDKCPVHKKSVEIIEEETYFFKLSKYQKALIEHIEENKDFIIPQSRRNEILSRLKEPLQDLSISRKNVKWGIPLPIDKDFTLFVWVDALINYLSTIDYPNEKFKKFWPANIHVIGKDIIWHHVVVWGGVLLAAGLKLPKTVFVHGFLTVDGRKMSKSFGNIIDPIRLVKKYGTDAVRYYLLREIPTFGDGDFSIKRFEERYNSDLANDLGNLISRVLAMIQKYDLKVSARDADSDYKNYITVFKKQWKIVPESIEKLEISEALTNIWTLVHYCNRYIDNARPWELAEINNKKLKQVISHFLYCISEVADLITPFLPETSEKIKKQLKSGKSQVLFPRI